MATVRANGRRYFLTGIGVICLSAFTGCREAGDSYASFSGAVNRVYIEDGSGGMILFTPHNDAPPMKDVYVYKQEEFVHLTIKDGWAEIYVPGHRTNYVLPAERIVRIDRILSKEENSAIRETLGKQIPQDLRSKVEPAVNP